ncbi:NAD-dependent epimerase/dehydratase family protein [Arhodomonas sp. AD133]|uniref:NAD-dependent epimerase/dehydratase family protein n=1 Tax=Arhodomonas sp. AD133 TaxID=3415009 RepID=UPI003EBE1B1F
MKVVVTGAAGYIGWSVVNALIDREAVTEVAVYDNFSRRNYGLLLTGKRPGYEKLSVNVDDILNSRGLRTVFSGADCVCHLAALAPSPYSDDHPHSFDQVNHWGTAEVCYATEDENVPRIVYVSSGAVYGFGDSPFDVSVDPMPATAYGTSKLAGERHVDRLSDSRDAVILRAGTVYGLNPVARFDTFLNRFVLDAALGRPVQVHGSGEQSRPVIHVERLADVITAAILGEVGTGRYDAVDENATVNAAVDALRSHTEKLEVIHMSQQERLRDLKMRPDTKIQSVSGTTHAVASELPQMLDQVALK